MKRDTVALTPFPFTDLSGQQVRPAPVVSRSSRARSDVVLAFITSVRGQLLLNTDLLLQAKRTSARTSAQPHSPRGARRR